MKKQKIMLPEVQILGDLTDVKNLVSWVNKKKTIVIFRDGDTETFYVEVKGKYRQINTEDLSYLEKEFRLIHFAFFPSRKKAEPVTDENPGGVESGKTEKKNVKKKLKKEKKAIKQSKEKKEKKKR